MSFPTEERFKKNFMTLVDIVEDMVIEANENGGCGITPVMFGVLKIIGRAMNARTLIEKFIRKTNKHWVKLKNKEIDYFKNIFIDLMNIVNDKGLDNVLEKEDKSITQGLNMGHLTSFKELLSMEYHVEGETKCIFNDERIDMTWKIIHSFIKQSILFIHETRMNGNDVYTLEYFPDIDVTANAEFWNIRKITSDKKNK